MLTPVFTHGTYEHTIEAIQQGKIKYPCYCWITDRGQYGFLNKSNELEVIGIPEFTGTLEEPIILSSLNDGIYQVKGIHKVISDAGTTFSSASFIIVIIQTIDGEQKIRRITADEIYDYTVSNGEITHETTQVTTDYLDEHGYVTEDVVDSKIQAMEASMQAYIENRVPEIIDESLDNYDESNIRDLFNN